MDKKQNPRWVVCVDELLIRERIHLVFRLVEQRQAVATLLIGNKIAISSTALVKKTMHIFNSLTVPHLY